jgi:hypothetical protein
MVDLYVYYMLRPEDAGKAESLVRDMQARLRATHGAHASLKRKPHLKDGLLTWMEVYTSVAEGFQVSLAQAAAESGLVELLAGARHTEVFVDLAACA